MGCGGARDAAEGWRVGGGQQIGTRPEEGLCRCMLRQEASKAALRYPYEVSPTPMEEAGLKGIRRRNLTAELGVRQGFLNTRLTTSHQPPAWQVLDPLPAQCVFCGKAALLQRDVWSREMMVRLDNRWIATSGVCAGSGAFKGLKHAVSHNRFAVRGRGERLHTKIDDR